MNGLMDNGNYWFSWYDMRKGSFLYRDTCEGNVCALNFHWKKLMFQSECRVKLKARFAFKHWKELKCLKASDELNLKDQLKWRSSKKLVAVQVCKLKSVGVITLELSVVSWCRLRYLPQLWQFFLVQRWQSETWKGSTCHLNWKHRHELKCHLKCDRWQQMNSRLNKEMVNWI